MLKRKVMALLAAGMMMMSASPVFAADLTNQYGDAGKLTSTGGQVTMSSSADSTMITGTITPVIISAVVPTQVTFNINPNKPANYTANPGTDTNVAFTSARARFLNTCNPPLTFSVASVEANADMPTVVAHDTFATADEPQEGKQVWNDISMADTKTNIAFGFVPVDGSRTENIDSKDVTLEWQAKDITDATSAWYKGTAAGEALQLGDIAGHKGAEFDLKAKYGMAWGNESERTITYKVVYKVDLAQ